MKILYDPPSIEKEYSNFKNNVRNYGLQFATKLESMISLIEIAESAHEVFTTPQYKMHMLHGDLQGVYSLSPDNKKSKWRVLAVCVDDNDVDCSSNNNEIEFLKGIHTFRIRRISDHYD